MFSITNTDENVFINNAFIFNLQILDANLQQCINMYEQLILDTVSYIFTFKIPEN